MKYFKPFSTFAVGVAVGAFVLPRIVRMAK